MKTVARIIPILCIFITTILSIVFLDFKQSSNYLQFDGYKKSFIRMNYNDDIAVDDTLIEHLLELADKNNVIIGKSNISNHDGKIKNIYLSFDNIEQLNHFLEENFKLKHMNIENSNSSGYISTYNHNDINQFGLISDLLENDYYNYYTFKELLSNDGNLYGEYIVYYKEYKDFDIFSNEVRNVIGEDIHSYSSFNNSQKYIIILILVSVLILMIFYFIFQIYDSYYKSKQIGCMKLLGFNNNKIANLMIKKRINVYLIIVSIVLLLSTLLIKNMNIYHILFLIIINILLIILTYFINYMCVKIILKGYQTSNMIKKQNIAIKISKTSSKLKTVTIIILITVVTLLFQSIMMLTSNLKEYNNSKELLNYGIINDFFADSKEIFNYKKHTDLYGYIVNDKRLNTFYSEFGDYYNRTEEEQALRDEWEASGSDFSYASVDRNYLKKEKIKIYNLDNKAIRLDEIDGIFFLFPKSRKDIISQFEKFYLSSSKQDYEKYNIHHQFNAYLYDDQILNSYRLNLEIKYVESPILRVIDESLKISYLESSRGISIFGNSLTTGLKIEIVNNKSETFKILDEHIQESGLEELISVNNFMSFYEYFNDAIQISRLISIIMALALIIVLGVYIVISSQVISLYIKSENQKVMVQSLLGFKKEDIFLPIIKKNIKNNIIAFIVSIIILLILKSFNWLLYMVSVTVFLMIDFFIIFLIIKFYDFTKIHEQLKGGKYD